MDQHQAGQEAELADGVVRAHDRLPALLTSDTHADVRLLNHGDIVGAVSDGKCHDIQPVLDQTHNGRLLRGRHTTAEHGPTLLAQ